jgi:Second Messenger Oligonucleotide or Dinucleotide Synthetase domain/Adenylyl/Guanylyl and SMODS C-terminal sensor domain
MNLTHSFNQFLEEDVSLDATRLTRIKDGIDTVDRFVRNEATFGPLYVGLSAQGSYRQGTGIRPPNDTDFDVDILLQLKPVAGWAPTDYLAQLDTAFASTKRYEDIVDKRGKHRCVTLDYADDFHIDLVPCIPSERADVVMNRTTNEFELTDGDGYSQWLQRQNALARGHLTSAIKLAKFLRDARGVPMKSVLLTTLLGTAITANDVQSDYADAPTALRTLMGRLDDFLGSQPAAPVIANPALHLETFSRPWDDAAFRAAAREIHTIREQIEAAYSAPDLEASLELWRVVFGDEFSLAEGDEAVGAGGDRPPLGDAHHQQPVTVIPGCTGERLGPRVRVRIDKASLYSANGRTRFRGIRSGARLRSGLRIKYKAATTARAPFEVYWQVVNTGAHARSVGGLRGGYHKGKLANGNLSPDSLVDWERTEYSGQHWIECFIVQGGFCVARSGRFVVRIKNPDY